VWLDKSLECWDAPEGGFLLSKKLDLDYPSRSLDRYVRKCFKEGKRLTKEVVRDWAEAVWVRLSDDETMELDGQVSKAQGVIQWIVRSTRILPTGDERWVKGQKADFKGRLAESDEETRRRRKRRRLGVSASPVSYVASLD
jgi:hypothetical protein